MQVKTVAVSRCRKLLNNINVTVFCIPQELVHARGSMSWGMRSGTYLEEYIKETDIEKYQHLFDGASFYSDENEEVIDDVRSGNLIS